MGLTELLGRKLRPSLDARCLVRCKTVPGDQAGGNRDPEWPGGWWKCHLPAQRMGNGPSVGITESTS